MNQYLNEMISEGIKEHPYAVGIGAGLIIGTAISFGLLAGPVVFYGIPIATATLIASHDSENKCTLPLVITAGFVVFHAPIIDYVINHPQAVAAATISAKMLKEKLDTSSIVATLDLDGCFNVFAAANNVPRKSIKLTEIITNSQCDIDNHDDGRCSISNWEIELSGDQTTLEACEQFLLDKGLKMTEVVN